MPQNPFCPYHVRFSFFFVRLGENQKHWRYKMKYLCGNCAPVLHVYWMMMKPKYPIRKLRSLTLWFTSVSVVFVFSFIMVFIGKKGFHEAIHGSVLTLIILMLVGFSNIGWLTLFKKRLQVHAVNSKKIHYTASYTLAVAIFLTVVLSYNQFIHERFDWVNTVSLITVSFFVNTLFITFHNYIILQDAKVHSDIENSQLKVANSEAANQLLRQQIHPHFFFNALNILKSLYKIDPKGAEDYLVCLSDFLRASVSNNNIKVIPLNEELNLCQDYLGMQKIRFGDALVCTVSIAEDVLQTGFVPSFSIQPLIENAIKHNELTDESPLHITIEQDQDRVKVSNRLKPKITTEASTGSGLANLAERYRFMTGDELIIENDGEHFSVSIKILSKETFLQLSAQKQAQPTYRLF